MLLAYLNTILSPTGSENCSGLSCHCTVARLPLGTYHVSGEVSNLISLQSYISTFVMMSLLMGLLFELPVLCWLLARMGLLTAPAMCRYRRHAIVAILILSAVITPTSDAFTLALVAFPVYLLYELSIVIVKRVG